MNSMYHPETYWNEVARRISKREGNQLIAGDDEPYYRYKRKKFLDLFHRIDFHKKKVLELGSGPGGNLLEIMKYQPEELHGADISDEMISVSEKLLNDKNVTITKIDGQNLPYPDKYFDLVFTSTVLQHNTNEAQLVILMKEVSRVAAKDIYLFEKIEKKIKGTPLCLGRPVAYYEAFFKEQGFTLQKVDYLNIEVSYLVSGTIRKLFNKRGRKEGEPASKFSRLLQRVSLPVTSVLDKIFKARRNVSMLHFTAIR
jgi:ubiquinone/menaquinone biosynthesis C-methylase UbiE